MERAEGLERQTVGRSGRMNVAVYLKWDSEVFGLDVAKMYIGENDQVSQEEIAQKCDRFDVVFVTTKRWVEFPSPFVPPGLDYLYDMESGPLASMPGSRVTTMSGPSDRHLEIARTSFRDSRFLRDPRLEGKAGEMYARWVSAGRVHVLVNEPDSAFMVTKRDADGAARISLIAVDEQCRRLGLGETLVQDVLDQSPGIWRVKVSARNHRSIRFYEKNGFIVKDAWTAFHVWPADWKVKEYKR